jgi:uncharacterized protein (TIGR03437 family)
VEVIVERPSTGQVLAAGFAEMDIVAPALFANGGRGQAAVVNQDGTVNSPSNPAARGSTIAIYATGMGDLPGSPADGALSGGNVTTPGFLQVIINGQFVPAANIKFSGLAPGSIALWQINVEVPTSVAPSNAVSLAIRYRDTASQGAVTFAVKQ